MRSVLMLFGSCIDAGLASRASRVERVWCRASCRVPSCVQSAELLVESRAACREQLPRVPKAAEIENC